MHETISRFYICTLVVATDMKIMYIASRYLVKQIDQNGKMDIEALPLAIVKRAKCYMRWACDGLSK